MYVQYFQHGFKPSSLCIWSESVNTQKQLLVCHLKHCICDCLHCIKRTVSHACLWKVCFENGCSLIETRHVPAHRDVTQQSGNASLFRGYRTTWSGSGHYGTVSGNVPLQLQCCWSAATSICDDTDTAGSAAISQINFTLIEYSKEYLLHLKKK